MPNVIADIMFLHERGAYNTLYFAFYFGGIMVSLFTHHYTLWLICTRSVPLLQVQWRITRAGETSGGSMLL